MCGLLGWDTTIVIWNLRVQKNIEKIDFKVVQIKFLAVHFTNHTLYLRKEYIFMEHDLYLIS